MIKILNTRLLTLLCFFLVGLAVSCKKDDNKNNGPASLLSFGPTGAMHGDTLRFIGNNLNMVTEIDFTGTGAVVPQSAFIDQTAEVIRVIVPEQAEKGFVTLKTPQGDIVSKSQLNLEVAPFVTTLTAEARPGQNVTLTGKYLNWVSRVTFGKDKFVDSFVSRSLTQLVVKVPEDAQTGPLILNYGGTEPLFVQTDDTLKVTLPMATGFSPTAVKQLQNVTIAGTNLDLVKKIIFTNVSEAVADSDFVSQSPTSIVVNVPAAANKGKVTLVAASGVTTQSSGELDIILPVITSISPNPLKHQANITITGTNLDLAKRLIFAGVTTPVTTFVSQSATQIVAKVPAGAINGKLSVATASGVSTQFGDDLQLILPAITGLSPNPVDSLTSLTITGTNLDLVSGIKFNGTTTPVTTFVSQSATRIVVKLPSRAKKGVVTLSVVNSTVTVTSTQILGFVGDLPPLASLAYAIYVDAFENGWQDWGWGRTADYTNKENVRDGDASMKVDFTGEWSGIKFANTTVSLANYREFTFSIYGTPGTGGKKINLSTKGGTGYSITLQEGKWVEYKLTKANLGNPEKLEEVQFQNEAWKGVIYMGHVGLR